jgi:Chaperone of endosialidase
MATKTFDQLPVITNTNDADKLPIWDASAGQAAGITVGNVLAGVLRVNGVNAMAADLDMGAWAITNVGNVDGVDVSGHAADATIHRSINDGSTSATVLWSASKISTELGDKLDEDGSIPLTADWNIGDGRYIAADKIRARDGDGLLLHDDGGNGIKVNDGGDILVSVAAGAAETILQAVVSDSANDFFAVRNSTSVSGRLAPMFEGYTESSALVPLLFLGGTNAASDTGATSVIQFQARRGNSTGGGAAITARNPFKFANYTTSLMEITAAGKVGVGTAAPDSPLHVHAASAGSVTAHSSSVITAEYNTTASIQILTPDNTGCYWVQGTPTNSFYNFMFALHSTTASANYFAIGTTGSNRVQIYDTKMIPSVDNTIGLGESGKRFVDVWAVNGTIQTSDVRKKQAVQDSDLGLEFILALEPKRWVWADQEITQERIVAGQVNEAGELPTVSETRIKTHKRPHYGLSAQQVKAAMDALKVDDFAGYIYDNETDAHALRYHEFTGPIIRAIQELHNRIGALNG